MSMVHWKNPLAKFVLLNTLEFVYHWKRKDWNYALLVNLFAVTRQPYTVRPSDFATTTKGSNLGSFCAKCPPARACRFGCEPSRLELASGGMAFASLVTRLV